MDERAFSAFLDQANPYQRLRSIEYIKSVLSFGSLFSMILDKKINIANLFVLILENKDVRDLFTEITETDNEYESLLGLLQLYPSLLKSKNAKRAFQKSKPGNKSKKTNI